MLRVSICVSCTTPFVVDVLCSFSLILSRALLKEKALYLLQRPRSPVFLEKSLYFIFELKEDI